ncbi:MAG: ParA family protein [Planctomycetota bacterium]|nr:ParA family protein [Planctomycetota bacterium]
MQVISVVNHKGGAAKTTTCVNLAAALVELNRRVLVIDLDPQASASLWLGVRTKGQEFLKAVMEGKDLDKLVQETSSGLHLVPCGPAFASFEKLAANQKGSEMYLKQAMSTLPDSWDYAFLDCPPSLNLTSVNALVASTRALAPVTAQVLSLEPLARLLDTMWQVRESLNPELQFNGMFATRVDNRTAHGPEVVRLLREQFGDNVYSISIRENVQLAEAAGFQKPVNQYAPSSNGAEDYRALAKEFEHRLKKELAKQEV